MSREKKTMIVCIRGGILQEIVSNFNSRGIDVILIDYDMQCEDPDDKVRVDGKNFMVEYDMYKFNGYMEEISKND